MKMKYLLGFIAIASASSAHARYGEGGWVFGGLGAGGLMVNSSEESDINLNNMESDKIGYAIHIKGGLSWYMHPSFVLDGMLGFNYSSVSGDAPAAGLEAVTISHRVGIFQLSPRFRFGDLGKWQIGPVYKLYFGTDTAFREFEGQGSGEKPVSHYFGLHLNYDIPSATEKLTYRVGLEALTDLSDVRDIYMASIVFEIGFNLWGTGSGTAPAEIESYPDDDKQDDAPVVEEDLTVEDPEPMPSEDDLAVTSEPAPEEAAPPVAAAPVEAAPAEQFDDENVAATASGNTVMIKFPGDRFQFETGMSHIGSKTTRTYIRELAQFMAAHDSAWDKGSIIGHTDRRGPPGRQREVNMELSEARARTVYNAMVAAGVNASKLRYEGRAFDEPVPGAPDNHQGFKLNRRVTVTFEGVRNPEKILSEVNDLNKRYGYKRVRATK